MATTTDTRSGPTGVFLSALFEQAIDDHGHIVTLFGLPSQTPRFARTIDEACEAVRSLETENVYVGAAPLARIPDARPSKANPEGPPRQGRGDVDDVGCLVALWADIDIAGPNHARKGLPASQEQAEEIIRRVGRAPSILVHSGHGLQAWWLLNEPLLIATDDDRRRAVMLARGWVQTCRECAKAMGMDLDPVGDIARIMRVPGTMNRKSDPHVPVTIVYAHPERRYDVPDLEDVMVAPELIGASLVTREAVGHLVISPDAEPPVLKFGDMMSDPKSKDTWERKRADAETRSWTASEWDMSLATIAANAGWTDQEICNLLIASRRKHGDKAKLRLDYYQRTVGKGKTDRAQREAVDDLHSGAMAAPDVSTDTDRAERLAKLSRVIGVEIARVIRQGREEPIFTLVMGTGEEIPIGPAGNVLNQSAFVGQLFKLTGATITRRKDREWQKVCEAIYRLSELIEHEGGTRVGLMREWLRGYVSGRYYGRNGDDEERVYGDAIASGSPFLRGGELYVHALGLRRFLMTDCGERITRETMADMLRASGFVPDKARARASDNTWAQRHYWRGPGSFVFETEEAER